MIEKKIFVRGMTCNHCKGAVEVQLRKIEGVDKVNADLDRQIVTISGDEIDLNQVRKMVEDIGYKYDGDVK
jgi:copper chaperone CopZ